jgi:membrane associated rhomboid family serine protease
MIPIGDVIPTRTPPVTTIALIAASVLLNTYVQLSGVAVLAFNMLFLWLFGRTAEDRLGHARFAMVYVLCGATAFALSGPFAVVGGAVGGVIGAYFSLYPKSIMLVLIPIPLMAVEMPAAIFLGLWCMLHFLIGVVTGPFAAFFAGAAFGWLMRRPERVRVEWWSP